MLDEVFGERLLISLEADKNELGSNIRAARAILGSYSEVCIHINARYQTRIEIERNKETLRP